MRLDASAEFTKPAADLMMVGATSLSTFEPLGAIA